MPILCFFSAVTNLLYYWGIIQFLIRHIGGILYFFIGTTPVETFIAVSAIFLGPVGAMLSASAFIRFSYAGHLSAHGEIECSHNDTIAAAHCHGACTGHH